jgi:hypothetical protein
LLGIGDRVGGHGGPAGSELIVLTPEGVGSGALAVKLYAPYCTFPKGLCLGDVAADSLPPGSGNPKVQLDRQRFLFAHRPKVSAVTSIHDADHCFCLSTVPYWMQ